MPTRLGNLIDLWLKARGFLTTQRRSISRKTPRKSPRKSYHKERYDFSDGYSALQTLVEEIERGEVKPAPKIFDGPDFGSWSAPSAIRSIEYGHPNPKAQGPISPPITHRLSFSPGQESLIADIPLPKNPYKPDTGPGACFGPSALSGPDRSALIGKKELGPPPPPIIGKRSAQVGANYVIREDHETMMKGTLPRPPPQPTLKDRWEMYEKKRESYYFGPP